jgi:ribosomal protein L25 (general stress protein Ctc)
MGLSKSYQQLNKKGPSTFALLVDDIRNMSAPQQKLLWMELNKEKISTFAKDIDTHVVSNNLNAAEINTLIKEAQKNGKRKKKR